MNDQATVQKAPRRGAGRLKEQAALLLVTLPTTRAVAVQLQIGEPTLYRWMKDEVFKQMMVEARRQVMSATVNRLVGTSLNAVEVLHSVANDPSAEHSAKVAASRSLLQYSIQAGVVDEIQARLTQLENVGTDE